MTKNAKKGLALGLAVAGAIATTIFAPSSSRALDCSAYEVDSGTETRCTRFGIRQERQFWIYYRAYGCNPGTETAYGPWYKIGTCGGGRIFGRGN